MIVMDVCMMIMLVIAETMVMSVVMIMKMGVMMRSEVMQQIVPYFKGTIAEHSNRIKYQEYGRTSLHTSKVKEKGCRVSDSLSINFNNCLEIRTVPLKNRAMAGIGIFNFLSCLFFTIPV